ncbi:J domain-containing protein [Brachybacterium paraconglomeratum]|uniref:J domain-containing protein n=1 Tax=Brachybacterium paraconglomeratum TaxID=173362 RepID=UPI0037CA1F8A
MALTHYETLGVPRNASKAEITSAFRTQMRALHGDAGGDDELAKHVSSAYNVLSNAARRAAYDRTLTPSPPPPPDSAPPWRRVFHTEQEPHAASMLDVDPTRWDWYTPPEERIDGADAKGESRRPFRMALLATAFIAWVLAGAAAATTLGLPLARIDALSTPVALLCGVGAHLIWSVLVITRTLPRRWGFIAAALVTTVGAVVIYLDAGTPLPMVGSVLCLLATTITTYLSFGMLLSRSPRQDGIIDSSFITQVGSTSLGSRHPDVEQLLGTLTGAFGHRDGVRVILLPDRVTPRPGVSLVRAQVAVVVGRAVYLIATPHLGADGLEIAGSEIIADGQVHRNVVQDEAEALRRNFGRGSEVHGYVIPTSLASAPVELSSAGGVSFGTLTQVLDAIGTNAGPNLDRPNTLFRHRALASMTLLV